MTIISVKLGRLPLIALLVLQICVLAVVHCACSRGLSNHAESSSGTSFDDIKGTQVTDTIREHRYDDGYVARWTVRTLTDGTEVKDGPYTLKDGTGQLRLVQNFVDDVREGDVLFYYEDGSLAQKSSYVAGLLHGRETKWHENGQKSEEGVYEAGRLVGKLSKWDSAGKALDE